MNVVTVDTTAPYNFTQMAVRLTTYEKSTYRQQNGKLWRTIRCEGTPLLLGIQFDESSRQLHVNVFNDAHSILIGAVEQKVRHMFSTDVDLSEFYRHVTDDSFIAPLTKQFSGLRIIREPDVFECLIKTVIGQQLNMAFAGTLVTRLIQLVGDTLTVNGEDWYVFPTPEQVARLQYEQLQNLQFSRRKAEYVIDLARHVVNGSLDLERLWEMSDDEVMDELTRLRGIGRWTVECLLLFGLGRDDLLPAADIGLRNALRKLYRLDKQPTEAEVRELGKTWSPWSSYVTFYLWESLT